VQYFFKYFGPSLIDIEPPVKRKAKGFYIYSLFSFLKNDKLLSRASAEKFSGALKDKTSQLYQDSLLAMADYIGGVGYVLT